MLQKVWAADKRTQGLYLRITSYLLYIQLYQQKLLGRFYHKKDVVNPWSDCFE